MSYPHDPGPNPGPWFALILVVAIVLFVAGHSAHAGEPPLMIAAPEAPVAAPPPQCGLPPAINVVCMERHYGEQILLECMNRDGESFTMIREPGAKA